MIGFLCCMLPESLFVRCPFTSCILSYIHACLKENRLQIIKHAHMYHYFLNKKAEKSALL